MTGGRSGTASAPDDAAYDGAYTDGGGELDELDMSGEFIADDGSEPHSELGTLGSNTVSGSRLDATGAHSSSLPQQHGTPITGGRKYRRRTNNSAVAESASTRHGRVY